MASLVWNPGLPGLWTSPTYRASQDIFLRKFKAAVPKELYAFKKSDQVIEWFNGSTIDVRTRNVDNPAKESKGGTYAWCGEDEIAYKYDKDRWEDTDLMVSHPDALCRFHSGYTTPKLNDYYNLVREPGHIMIHAQTKDNPFIDPGVYKRLYESMSPKRRAQELEGAFVALEGLVFDSWSDDPWPMGNIHDHEHDFQMPYFLFFDLGSATAAFAIVQRVKGVWVITAEYTPRRSDASIDASFARIKLAYGQPVKVVAGHDLATRESGSGKKHSWYITKHFGRVPTMAIGGDWRADKQIQHNQMETAILDNRGKRLLCVSKYLKSHDHKEKRGVLEMMREYTWPEDRKGISTNNYLDKDGRLEHIFDALAYGTVGAINPPDFRLHQNCAA